LRARRALRTYVEKASLPLKSDGAARQTWGLSINGQTIESVQGALDANRTRKRLLLPSLALVQAAVSLIGFRRARQPVP